MQFSLVLIQALLLISSLVSYMKCESHYDITFRRIDCTDIDQKHILNLTCHIKAVRGKKGILNLYWIYKDVDDAFCSFKFFYRNANGRYLPYIVDATLDLCKMNTGENRILAILAKFYTEHLPALEKGCPINGPNNWLDWDINEHISELLPPIIPEGDFRLVMRVFDDKNHTFIELKYALAVKGTGVMKMSMLNMGK